jgi:hypothetical protein
LGCFCREAIDISHAPGALNEKIKDPRATGAPVGRATDGNADDFAAATLNEKPYQAG